MSLKKNHNKLIKTQNSGDKKAQEVLLLIKITSNVTKIQVYEMTIKLKYPDKTLDDESQHFYANLSSYGVQKRK